MDSNELNADDGAHDHEPSNLPLPHNRAVHANRPRGSCNNRRIRDPPSGSVEASKQHYDRSLSSQGDEENTRGRDSNFSLPTDAASKKLLLETALRPAITEEPPARSDSSRLHQKHASSKRDNGATSASVRQSSARGLPDDRVGCHQLKVPKQLIGTKKQDNLEWSDKGAQGYPTLETNNPNATGRTSYSCTSPDNASSNFKPPGPQKNNRDDKTAKAVAVKSPLLKIGGRWSRYIIKEKRSEAPTASDLHHRQPGLEEDVEDDRATSSVLPPAPPLTRARPRPREQVLPGAVAVPGIGNDTSPPPTRRTQLQDSNMSAVIPRRQDTLSMPPLPAEIVDIEEVRRLRQEIDDYRDIVQNAAVAQALATGVAMEAPPNREDKDASHGDTKLLICGVAPCLSGRWCVILSLGVVLCGLAVGLGVALGLALNQESPSLPAGSQSLSPSLSPSMPPAPNFFSHSPAPSRSTPFPSLSPTSAYQSMSLSPSVSPTSSFSPSMVPSTHPSVSPTVTKTPSMPPSVPPTNMPSESPSFSPTFAPTTRPPSSVINSTVVIVVAVLSSAAVLVALFLCIWNLRRQEQEMKVLTTGDNRFHGASQALEVQHQLESGESRTQQ